MTFSRLGWALLAVVLSGCQLLTSRGSASTFTPEVLAQTAGPAASPTVPEATSPGLIPDLTDTPFPPAPSETPIPPSPTASPTPTLLPSASALPDPSGYAWAPLVSGLDRPTDLTHAGDGSGRIFVLEQVGRIRVIQDGQLQPSPFLDISAQVGSGASEQGLLGIAFHPEFSSNGFFYVNYTDRNGDTVIARFQTGPDLERADPASEARLLLVDQPFPNHNGGGLAFGPDGMLYVALGDGGAANDPLGNGQSLNTLLGKLLRIDVSLQEPYAIPADNPFASGGGLLEIWAYGLRNPWRVSFDPLTGDLYMGDVGQGTWEEIDFQEAGTPGGLNFGWVYREGSHAFRGNPPEGQPLVDPVAEYSHASGCSVTGGHVYRGASLPEWRGVYLYGDYCSGLVWGLLRVADGGWQNELLFQTGQRISSFGVDEAGEIYLVGHGGGIFRLASQ